MKQISSKLKKKCYHAREHTSVKKFTAEFTEEENAGVLNTREFILTYLVRWIESIVS